MTPKYEVIIYWSQETRRLSRKFQNSPAAPRTANPIRKRSPTPRSSSRNGSRPQKS